MQQEKIPVGISSCRMGEKVRFDGGHQRRSYIEQTLGTHFAFRSFCPEVAIGLGIPRRPIRLIVAGDGVRCYLKNHIDSGDKAELNDVIAQYLHGQVPLIVPITLLNHHFRRHPDDYIRDSWYMRPYPAEMSLQNDI